MSTESEQESALRLKKTWRISEHDWPKGNTPVVSIICPAYNHEKFIEQCLEGFLMQETTFPVEIIVHDDASTDRTADIIRAYAERHPEVFHTFLQTENQMQAGKDIMPPLYAAARGTYVSICEGDDYWTNPHKLEMQVEFLESHPDLALCHTLVEKVLTENGATTIIDTLPLVEFRRESNVADLIACNFIITGSTMFRREWMPKFDAYGRPPNIGDWPLWFLLAQRGGIGFINSLTSCYRIHSHNKFALLPWEDQSIQISEALFFIASQADHAHSGRLLKQAELLTVTAASGQSGFVKATKVLWSLCRRNPATRFPLLRFLAALPMVHLTILKRKLRLSSRLKGLVG